MINTLFVRRNDRHVKILVSDILFIQAQGSYLELVTKQDKYSVALNLSQFLRKNPIENLIRVHRSYIINIRALDSFDHGFVYLGKHQIPIGDSFREQFMKDIHSF
jgi:DNA-binding LytR/AlgR family response regulator